MSETICAFRVSTGLTEQFTAAIKEHDRSARP